MTTFSANFLSKTAIGLRYRAPLLSWVEKSCGMACSCSKRRDYSTSLPLGYISDKSSHCKPSRAASLLTERFGGFKKNKAFEQYVERSKLHRGGKGSCKNFASDDQKPVSFTNLSGELEDKYTEEPNELEEELGSNLVDYSNESSQKKDAENFLIRVLAKRAYTAAQLKKKLQGKKFPLNVVNAVITDFENRGFINDSLYAESLSQSRWSSSCWGPKRIKHALFERGISKVDAEKAITGVFQDGESGEDYEARLGISKLSMDHLITQASKQWLKSQGLPIDKRKSRLVMWLQYRGFNWGVTNFVLKKLESEYPP